MARNPAAQTALGPMVLAAVDQIEPPARRLVNDDLADLFLPAPLRLLVAATRVTPLQQLMIRGSEWAGPGQWANLACRKRFIADKLAEARDDINAVVILGAGLDTRAYLLNRQIRMPVFYGRPAGEQSLHGQDGPTGAGRAAAIGSAGRTRGALRGAHRTRPQGVAAGMVGVRVDRSPLSSPCSKWPRCVANERHHGSPRLMSMTSSAVVRYARRAARRTRGRGADLRGSQGWRGAVFRWPCPGSLFGRERHAIRERVRAERRAGGRHIPDARGCLVCDPSTAPETNKGR